MYFYLKGKIVEIYVDSVVIDVLNVGYQVLMAHPENYVIGDEVLIYISHIVREDDEFFVGFSSLEEKSIFMKLINCKGIGPKTAINALRDITIDEFVLAIENSDVKRLKKLPGIGPKAASQIILDLHGKLTFEETKSNKKSNQAKEDAKLALKNLGFKIKEIEDCLDKIDDDTLSCEEYITQVLRMIRKG